MNERDNLFTGVNPLLMSRLQVRGEFEGFHSMYIGGLVGHLNERLPDNYYAHLAVKLDLYHRIIAGSRYEDIFRHKKQYTHLTSDELETSPTLFVPISDFVLEKRDMVVAIWETSHEMPFMIIEMLTPTKKLGGKDAYTEKRKEFIQSNIILVEIDILHASPSPIDYIPLYPHHEGATPYYIAMTNLQETYKTAIYQFGISQPMPTIRLPLFDGDSVLCDFDAVYQKAFVNGRFYMDINYADAPMELGAYRQSDQMAILSHLAKIRDAN